IITVNPPNTLYIVFCYTPYETKNTFSKEKAAVRIGCFFFIVRAVGGSTSSANPMAMAERLRISLYKITGQPLTTPKYEKIGF
ncbi:hypothetical protein, partial [Catenibacillus scindens]|uniref:hypothetical protein n=1 Tax=Catenibacillus scindens TaxID=673271 RepID=UPI003209B9F9